MKIKISPKKVVFFVLLLSYMSFVNAYAKTSSIDSINTNKSVKIVKGNNQADSLYYFNKGKYYEDGKVISKAIESYKAAIKKNPKLLEAYSRLGLIYAEKGDYKNSIKMFKVYLKYSKDPEEKALITQFVNKMSNLVKYKK